MRGRELGRDVLVAPFVCVPSWLALAIGAGNVGLQRSVSIGPATLLEQPFALTFVAVAAFVASAAVGGRIASLTPVRIAVAVLVSDCVGAAFIAPLAIGELTPLDAPIVFAALTGLGVQPVASFAGAWFGSALRRPRSAG